MLCNCENAACGSQINNVQEKKNDKIIKYLIVISHL